MQKTTTPLKKADLAKINNEKALIEPSDETLKKIMQFAACYRTQVLKKNQFIEMYLN